MDLDTSYKPETDFWDNNIQIEYPTGKGVKYTNNMNYQQYFSLYPHLQYIADFFGDIEGKRLLDMGCGSGWVSVYFARSNAKSFCCDISPQSVEVAKRIAKANGVEGKIRPMIMAAEKLEFPEQYFDFVFGNAVLHHTNIQKVEKEVLRVLKKGGKAAFIEPLGYNPAYRIHWCFTPKRHSPNEKPLLYDDIKNLAKSFTQASFQEFSLLSPRPFAINSPFTKTERVLLKTLPWLKRWCMTIVVRLTK